jgi:signal transduction histidine kinase
MHPRHSFDERVKVFKSISESGTLPRYLGTAARVLEARFEEVFAAYEKRLLAMDSPLVAEAETREQLRAQARSILGEVAAHLRGRGMPSGTQQSDHLSESIGVSRARGNVHASESLRAVVALSEAALSVVVDNLPPSPTSRTEVAAVALAIQKSIMERVARAGVAYANYLLEKVHESHADERRRISRELHDRVAHFIMVAFRSLELYEMYRDKEPSKAQAKLVHAKNTTQEALELTRSLSRELRSTSAEEGLKVALSELLSTSVPHGIRSWVSVEGDEAVIQPQVVREELFLILREGIRNAVNHSAGSTIKIEVRIAESHVNAAVEDDGRGFEPGEEASHTRGTGLASMQERATLLGGTLDVTSAPSKGTKVEVFLPLPRSRR